MSFQPCVSNSREMTQKRRGILTANGNGVINSNMNARSPWAFTRDC